jgi:hypothetical protein
MPTTKSEEYSNRFFFVSLRFIADDDAMQCDAVLRRQPRFFFALFRRFSVTVHRSGLFWRAETAKM